MLKTKRLATVFGINGGTAYVEATWDDKGEQEDGTFLDPTATMLVSNVTFQNTTEIERHANVGGVIYDIPAGTPRTSRNIPSGQRVRLDAIGYFSLY